MKDPLCLAAWLAMSAGLLSLALLFGAALAIGLGVAKFWRRRTGGDTPIEPAAREPCGEMEGAAFTPIAYQPADLEPLFDGISAGPAKALVAMEAADRLLDAHLRRYTPPISCPWCGRRHDSAAGARFCFEMHKEGATTP